MQAEPYANGAEMFTENYLKAEQLYKQAIKLDPNFAAAHACLSMVESWAYHTFDPTPAAARRRLHRPMTLCVFSPIFRKDISLSGSHTIMATATTIAHWLNSKSLVAICLTMPRLTWRSARSNVVR